VAEGARLESVFRGNSNVGSNPTLSAILLGCELRRFPNPAQAKLGRATRLDCLKATAKRAGLNPDEFWLHRFRATFATWHLWAGVDLRTVQQWLGHSDMESTMRYLKPSREEKTRLKVNATFA